MVVANFRYPDSWKKLVYTDCLYSFYRLRRVSVAVDKFYNSCLHSDVITYSDFDYRDDDVVRQWLYDLQPCINVLYDEWVKEREAFSQSVQEYINNFIDIYCKVRDYYKTLLKYDDFIVDSSAILAVVAIDFTIALNNKE